MPLKKAGIGIQNTKHGVMDLPFASLNKYAGHKEGGIMESKKMVQKEVNFMQKKGAPPSMLKHEKAEAKGMQFAKGGSIMRSKKNIGEDQMKMAPYANGGGIRGNTGYQGRGVMENKVSAGNDTAGENPKVQKRGLTEGRMVKMATGGIVKFARGGGIESRGKTKGRMC